MESKFITSLLARPGSNCFIDKKASILQYIFIPFIVLLSACGNPDNGTPTNEIPTASFTATPKSGAPPLLVQFDATASVDLDGQINDYHWDFGDSTTDTGLMVSHAYALDGVYTVTLTVTDNENAKDQANTQIAIGSSDNNPDNYSAASSVYFSRDYSSENANDMWINGGGTVASHTWGANYGFNNSGAWKLTPTMATLPNETNAGLSAGNGSDIPYNDTQVMVISYMIYMSQGMADAISTGTGGFWLHGNKIIDVFNWNTVSQNQGLDSTRQVIKVRSDAGRVSFSHMVGGAGSEFFSDGTNQNLRFEQNADQWIWISHVFDATNEVTRTYYKRDGDLSVSKALERFSTDGEGPESYSYTSAGWTLYQPGGGPARSIWGYWDDIGGIADDPNLFVILDRLRITNGWVDPPF